MSLISLNRAAVRQAFKKIVGGFITTYSIDADRMQFRIAVVGKWRKPRIVRVRYAIKVERATADWRDVNRSAKGFKFFDSRQKIQSIIVPKYENIQEKKRVNGNILTQ